MNFSTKISIPEDYYMNVWDQYILTGSCFSEHIGDYMSRCGLNAIQNPHGILFNPFSIFQSLNNALKKRYYNEETILQHNGLYFSWMHHSSVYDMTEKDLLRRINTDIDAFNLHLKSARTLIITWGSAHYYLNVDKNKIVSNCHKQPGQLFEKKMAKVEDIVNQYSTFFNDLIREVPQIKVVMTISPVHYLKDGEVENQRSKATLILAIEELCRNFPDSVKYFPSYEIFMDELRDYRFYGKDMVHPNEVGIEYVWKRMKETYFSPEQRFILSEAERIFQLKNHRILIPEAESSLSFAKKRDDQISEFKAKYPYLNI